MLCTGFWVCSVISPWICRSVKVILFYSDNLFFNTLCLYFTILFRKNKLLVCYILNNFIEILYAHLWYASSFFQGSYFLPPGCFQCFGNFFHDIAPSAPARWSYMLCIIFHDFQAFSSDFSYYFAVTLPEIFAKNGKIFP